MDAVAQVAAPHAVVVQQERLGTAHAALQAAELFGDGDVAVLYADNPLITPATLRRLRQRRAAGDVGAGAAGHAPGRSRPLRPGDRRATALSSASSNGPTPPRRSAPMGLCNAGVLCAEAGRMRALAAGGAATTTPRANTT